MASPIQNYAFINAKLRARISKFLSPEFLAQMGRSQSLPEAIELLKGGPYDPIVSTYNQTGDLKMSELALLRMEIALLRDLERQVRVRIRDLIVALEMNYDIGSLKNSLRLWFDKTVRRRDITDSIGYQLRDTVCYDLQVDRILAAAGVEEVVQILKKTPYAAVIASKADELKAEQSLFPIEVALDQLYYRQLVQAIDRLDRTDAAIAHRIVGVEIDLLNVTWITRFKHFYNLPLERTMRLVIPHGRSIRRVTIETAYSSPDPEGAVATLVSAQHPALQTLLAGREKYGTGRVILIEQILEEVLEAEVRKCLAGYPFTVGIILAYFVLRRQEMRKVMTILNAKSYGISEERMARRP